jgi:5'-3' exonuclease
VNFDPADTAKVQREMYSALKARREALEDILRKKTEELKNLCIKEGVRRLLSCRIESVQYSVLKD